MINPFADYYATLDDASLLVVLRNPDDHQPLAVEAARLELERRNLTDTQREIADADLAQREQTASAVQWHGLWSAVAWIKNHIPVANVPFLIQVTEFTGGRRGVFILTILTVISTVHSAIAVIPYLQFSVREHEYDLFFFLAVAALLPAIFAPALLWMRKTAGWVLCAGIAAFTVASTQTQFTGELLALHYLPQPEYDVHSDMLFGLFAYTPNPWQHLPELIVSTLLLAFICRKSIVDEFSISPHLKARALLIPLVVGTLLYTVMLWWKYSTYMDGISSPY